jgi:hypothetical protein
MKTWTGPLAGLKLISPLEDLKVLNMDSILRSRLREPCTLDEIIILSVFCPIVELSYCWVISGSVKGLCDAA